ncbi:MAG: CvpA family protein [Chloroflexi bacterium]|nr:CvpA family protein [Chloroflexota bacterium]
MNWLDFVIIGIWALGFFVGWRLGLFGAIFTAGGLVVGVLIAGRLADNVSELITDSVSSDSLATVIAYGFIIFVVFIGAQILRAIVKGIMKMVFLGWVDSLGGVALGLVMGVVLSGAFIAALARYSSDLPTEILDNAALEIIIDRSGIQEKLHTALMDSKLVPVFLDIRGSIPGHALGFVPDDFKVALDVLEAEIDRTE